MATAVDAPSCPCPQCGFAVPVPIASDADTLLRQAREQIQALESQVALLDQKAAAAIDRWADYEDELAALRRKLAAAGSNTSNNNPPLTPASPTRTSFLPTGAANRLSALLSPRPAKSTPNLKAAAAADSMAAPPLPTLPPPSPSQPRSQPAAQTLAQAGVITVGMPTPPPSATTNTNTVNTPGGYGYDSAATSPAAPRTPYGSFPFFGGGAKSMPQTPQPQPEDNGPSTKELLDALTREQKLRRQAEGRLQDTSREVEELSVSLFEQANEMVAEERRARARLEARVAVLEQRDTDKKRRLERLEQAMDRIERLRAMLGGIGDGSGNDRNRPARDDEASLHEKQKRPVAAALA
ncbi:hypothetical protein Sste5346_005734 [Sporothrix stenoceras]|uniref:GDP/GTP exchange factor Sec2 N-terminal domain-containing protein n=1 Tax=Sporothrix stenoceras TaxID=5173 RepID=A0ABR3Z2A1_9PEZI